MRGDGNTTRRSRTQRQ